MTNAPFHRLVSIFGSLLDKLGIGPDTVGVDEPTNVSGTRVFIAPPRGFTEADNICGFQHAASQSTLMITEMPAPVDQIIKGFDAPTLATRGIKLISKNAVEVSGLNGILLQLQQKHLGEFHRKWVAVFGNSHDTVIVMATYPGRETGIGDTLKTAVLSVHWDPETSVDPLASMPFLVTPPQGMRLAHQLQKMLLYTSDGQLNKKTTRDPMFCIGQSAGVRDNEDVKKFSTQRLGRTDGFYNFEIRRERLLKVNGLESYEIDADAIDMRTQEPVSLYQLLIFNDADPTYFIAQGIVHRELASQYGPIFESSAQSFRLR